MGKRFAIVVAVAAAGVMTLGAQTAAAARYDTKVTIIQDRQPPNTFLHGEVISGVRKCEVGRRVVVFKQRPGVDRLLAATRSYVHGETFWGMYVPQAKTGWNVYARVRGVVRRHGLVCRSDHSPIHTVGALYKTTVTITQDRHAFFHGEVISPIRMCEVGRRVTLFKQQPGTDRKLGEVRSSTGTRAAPPGVWGIKVPQAKAGWHVYARARRDVRRQVFVCLPRRSPLYTVR